MKKIMVTFLMLMAVLMLSMSSAQATSFTFGDDNNFWPGYQNNSPDDNKDVIGGAPDVIGGKAIVDGSGILTEVDFNYSVYDYLVPTASLFIDAGSNGYWDYVIQAKGSKLHLYSFSGFDYSVKSNYVLSSWMNSNFREEHPFQANLEVLDYTDLGIYTGFSKTTGAFAYTGLSVLVGNGNFTIGWVPLCANDVIYESVPEPTQMLLLGTALIGLAGIGRKKFFKK
jgi:hypothetical protein